jgi:hypothetical protein
VTVGYDVFGVIQVKRADPELFWILWIDSQLQAGSSMKTSQNLTESEVRTELKENGRTEAEIDSLIRRARESPR